MKVVFENDEIMLLDYDFNEDELGLEFDKHIANAVPYESETQEPITRWLIARFIEFPFADKVKQDFHVEGRPRFYLQEAGFDLPFHVDKGTQCSINILLDEENPAEVSFESGNSYKYKVCLLNTTLSHGVFGNKEERHLFKLSIFDRTFEEMKDHIRKISS